MCILKILSYWQNIEEDTWMFANINIVLELRELIVKMSRLLKNDLLWKFKKIQKANRLFDISPLGCALRYYKHRHEVCSVLFSFLLVCDWSLVCSSLYSQSKGTQWLSYCEYSPVNICYPLLHGPVDIL